MKYYKSCKKEHNIAIECNTIRLGTFQDYRDMDSSFSIADNEEGFTNIEIQAENLKISTKQWNDIIGTSGALMIGSSGEVTAGGNSKTDLVKEVNYNDGGGTYQFNEGHVTLDGTSSLKVTCPNLYMFCLSTKAVKPEEIFKEYNSQYYFTESTISNLTNLLSELLISQFKVRYIENNFKGEISLDELYCTPRVQVIDYVNNKKIILKECNEFTTNFLEDTILKGMFEKNENKYSDDSEYRILLPIYHEEYGIIPVKKDALFLMLNDEIKKIVFES